MMANDKQKDEKKDRITINVHDEYFDLYQNIQSRSEWNSRDNLKLFTITVLIGKYIVNKPISLKGHKHSYLRVRDNEKKDDMTLLKCFAICESDDVNILDDENAMFDLCEKYTTSGIKQLAEWYKDSNEEDIILRLSNLLTDKFIENSL